ncbi:MAG: hypothetical protein OES32_15685 [Acidobacteriota bacterium]|nr:hypothetical protein [Acidobacteriota bacterium]MDH3525022.1 hypothetical protein [Acidobacteriota bacterium]
MARRPQSKPTPARARETSADGDPQRRLAPPAAGRSGDRAAAATHCLRLGDLFGDYSEQTGAFFG